MPRFEFNELTADDLPLIASWLGRPHVAAWWGSTDGWPAQARASLGQSWFQAYRVDLDGRALGYLQCYDARAEPSGFWRNQPRGAHGIDLFIAEAESLGRAYGTAFIR